MEDAAVDENARRQA